MEYGIRERAMTNRALSSEGKRECGVEGCRWCAAGKEMEGRELRRDETEATVPHAWTGVAMCGVVQQDAES